MSHRCVVALVFFVFGAGFGFAQPLEVLGINDRSDNHVNTASFIVPTTAGHSYLVLLDGQRVPVGATNRVVGPDYHEIQVWRTNVTTGVVTNRLVRFVIMNDRGDPERGLITWTPYPQIPSTSAEFSGATLSLMMPADYPAGIGIPVIARVDNPSGHARRVNGALTSPGFPSIRILRGHGSGFLPAGAPFTRVEYDAQAGSIGAYKEVNIDAATTWTTVSGTLSANTTWAENSRIHITGNVTIPATVTLTIEAGTVVRLNPLVSITNTGRTMINGTVDRPVVFTSTNTSVLPSARTIAWGGFFLRNTAAQLVANNAIFVGGGGGTNSFSPGSSHRPEQAVFLVHSGARMALTNCAVINTAGQVANGFNSDINYDHCLFQRAITAGECVGGTIIINQSAIIEFPEDNGVNNATLASFDYDAIYFTTGTHLIYNTLLGFCKDDAIDSGSGGAGTVLMTNCWVESALHEANAWSGGGRVAEVYNTVLMNSGQGFECGWTEGGGTSPLCYAGDMLSIGNSVGARFGDNYASIGSGVNGFMRVTNSFILHNYRDVWGMALVNNNGWYYRSNQMDIRNNFISQANSFHPTNTTWDGAQDGWRLARFMTTPPNAPVGIGFATWSNTLPISTIFDGIPVRLSSFTTNTVQVDYEFQSGGLMPVSGTITFVPGETVKRIFPYGFNVTSFPNPRVILANPVGGELTGNTNVQFQGTANNPFLTPVFTTGQHGRAQIPEGHPLRLFAPSGLPMSFGYRYEWPGGILRTGLVTFQPGETLAWTEPPDGDLDGIDIVRFALSQPFLRDAYYFDLPPPPPLPPPTLLIASNAFWRYPNLLGAPASNWRDLNFNDTTWSNGMAQLGFATAADPEFDMATVITNFGPQGQVTYYFRHRFTVDDPNEFANLSLTLLRDDAGVVHLNGREVYRSPNLPSGTIGHVTTSQGTNGENTLDFAIINRTNLVAGPNIAAVDIHQANATSSDVSFALTLEGNPAPPRPSVYILRYGSQVLIAWNELSFVLEEASSLSGVWQQITSPRTSPFVPPGGFSASPRFYRLKR